jgi:nucleoside diphosphate kinase
MAIERSFVFVRPPHSLNEGRAVEIIGYLDGLLARESFTRSKDICPLQPPRELLEKHYAHCKNLPFFADMIRNYSQAILPVVYLGEDICQRIFDAVGATDPSGEEEWKLRRRFSLAPKGKDYGVKSFYGYCDSLQHAKEEGRAVENVLHRSGYHFKTKSWEKIWEAEQEIALWAEFLKSYEVDIPELAEAA